VVATPARGQGGKPDAAEAAAAMQRAERIASNPMRLILQASKINPGRKPAGDEPPAATASMRAAAPVLVASVASLPGAAPRAVSDAVVEPAPAAVQSVYRADARLTTAAPAMVAPLSAGMAPDAVPVAALSTATPALVAVANEAAPQLKRMVEVELPPQVLDQLRPGQEVLVRFMVAADGSVSDVSVPAPAPRQLARFVQAAVSQWQFEPMAAARTHAVQLVFNPR
jgi:Gram-negative bacterial TonB protein C-terminal